MSDRKNARRAESANNADVTRVRAITIAFVVGLVATLAVLALSLTRASARVQSVGALSPQHVKAGVACASCHANGDTTKATCTGCHDARLHVSTRPAHRALAQKGELACSSCHPAHGEAYGVRFGDEKHATIFRADAVKAFTPSIAAKSGSVVPLVRTERCVSCHSLSKSSDPILRCIDPSGFSRCFDEHETPLVPRANAGVCGQQHDPNRYVAWEAAAAAMSEQIPAPKNDDRAPPLAAAFGLALGLSSYVVATRRRKTAKGAGSAGALPVVANARKLPVINAETCLGCYACVDACPFDVIEIERYVARVSRPNDCCGVVLCEQVCPNGSLVVVIDAREGERGVELDEHGESVDVPGVFVVGDLSGLPLIKNAIAQGARAVARVREQAKNKLELRSSKLDVELAIIGAGPAGLSAAMAAKEAKLTAVTFERGEIAASIRAFPRDKLVFDAPLTLPVEGPLEFRQATKEELVATWTRVARKHALAIEEDTRVVDVVREDAGFRIKAEKKNGTAREITARFVLFATGKHGTPRPFDAHVDDGARAMVHRFLADARSFEGKRVVVVGLGDSAMEAAIAIAKQPGAHVTVIHRGKDFSRGRPKNIAELRHLAASGAVDVKFEARVTRVTSGLVILGHATDSARAPAPIEASAVFVLIGGVPAWELLARAGVNRENFSAPKTSNPEVEHS